MNATKNDFKSFSLRGASRFAKSWAEEDREKIDDLVANVSPPWHPRMRSFMAKNDSPRARDDRAKRTTSPNLISGDKTDSTEVWMVIALIGVTAYSSSMGDRARIRALPSGGRILAGIVNLAT